MALGISIFSILFYYSLACVSCGLLICRVLANRKDAYPNDAVVIATAFLLGQGTLATVWILLSLAGQFSPVIVMILVSIAILSGLPFFPARLKGLWAQIKNTYRETRSDSWAWQTIACMGLLFCFAGVSSLGAPLLEDSANFYMTQPKVVAETYRYQFIPFKDTYYSGGFQGEMNNAVLMSLGSADAARLYSWVTVLAGAVILLGLCARAGIGRRGQWLALVMIMTSSVINTIGKGKVDLFQMAMSLGVYYWMTFDSVHARRISGLLAGFTVVGKAIYAVTLLPGMLILLAWQQFQKRSDNTSLSSFFLNFLRDGLELAFWGGLSITSMFIYNYVLFDNLFQVNVFASAFLGWKLFGEFVPPHIYVTAPLYLAFGQLRYGQLGNLSVLVLMFAPLVLLVPRPKRWMDNVLVALTISAFSGVLILAIFYPTLITIPRYYTACLFLFIPLSAYAAEYITLAESKPRILTFVVQATVMIVLFSTFIENTQEGYYNSFFFKKSAQYLQGNIPECGLEDGWLGQRCRALSVVNKQAQPGDRVLSSAIHDYYLRSDLLLCMNPNWGLLNNSESWSPNWEEIYSNGYRFLVVDKFYTAKFPDVSKHPSWVNPSKIFEEGDLIVYRFDYIDPPEIPLFTCREIQKGVWKVVSYSRK